MGTTDAQTRLRRLQIIRLVVFLLLLISSLVGLVVVDNLLVSFVFAVVVTYLISPVISYLEGRGLSRAAAIALVSILFSASIVIGIWAVTPLFSAQFHSLKDSLPRYVDGAVKMIDDLASTIEISTGGLLHFDLSDRVRAWLTHQSQMLAEDLPKIVSSSASVLFLSPLLGFFILKDGRRISREILKFVPNNIFELILSLQHQISEQIGQFIRVRLIESLIVSAVIVVGLWIIGFPYAVILAIFAGAANLIPYIGPLVGAAPGVIIALTNQDSSLGLLLLAIVYLVAQLVDNFLVIPLLVARIVNLHPVTVILVATLGAELMGVMGMLVSIPVASALKVTFTNIYNHLTDYTG